jgi:hypothetical protein
MTKRESLKLIERAYYALPDLTRGFTDERERLYAKCMESERQHRKWKPDGIRCGISAPVAARLFAVKFLADSLAEPEKFTVHDVLSIRAEAIHAQALVAEFGPEIAAAWEKAKVDPALVRSLNYAELVK